MKTDSTVLAALLDQLALTMKEQLAMDPNASTMNVVRQFLKDNGITARVAKGSPLGNLVDSLPTFAPEDGDEDDLPITH